MSLHKIITTFHHDIFEYNNENPSLYDVYDVVGYRLYLTSVHHPPLTYLYH